MTVVIIKTIFGYFTLIVSTAFTAYVGTSPLSRREHFKDTNVTKIYKVSQFVDLES